MIGFPHLLAPDLLRTLGLSLLHFLWQGAALAALSAAVLAAVRSASTRYVVALLTLVVMIAAPIVTFLSIRPTEPFAAPVTPVVIPAVSQVVHAASQPAAATSESSPLPAGALNWLVGVWFAGVILFSLRTAGGFFLITRLRRDVHPLEAEVLGICREMQLRLGISGTIRYCQSLHLDAPAVLGWFRPAVLLPVTALTGLTEVQLRAVIAHELAHIRRLDAFFNLLQVAAETVLFYHPAVWWLSKRIRFERENCCDDVALAVCGDPSEYARALAQMEEWRSAPHLAMAANRGPLASRVARLLGLPEQGSSLRNAGIVFGTLCLAIALVAGNAFFGLVRSASAHSLPPWQDVAPQDQTTGGEIVISAPRPDPRLSAAPRPSPSPQPDSNSGDPQAAQPQSFIDSMKAEGFDNLSADELISLKVQGVTPGYIHEIRAEGLKPSVDELVGLKVQGITPEYIRKVRAMNLNVDLDQLIGMKVQGVTPEYVDSMRKLGFQSDADQLIGMKVQGITPEYIDSMRKLGFQPDADQLIGMKVQGITPEYVEEMRKIGFQPDADQVIGMKVQGITPQYVRELNELNIHPDADNVIGMKVQGVDASFVRSIRATGLSPDDDSLIALKVQGVTAEYIKALQAAGFKPDVDDVVSAKVMNITPQFIELARSHGFKNLDLEKLIELKHADVLE